MYKILTDTNQVLGYVDKPNYIKLAENGDILSAVPVEAVGLNFKGVLYLDPEDSKVYQCKRTGEAEGGTVELQYLPHELVGQYFVEV